MDTPEKPKNAIGILREAVNTYMTDPIVLLPFVTVAFIQLLVLEVLYFSPRFPLVAFFGPLIKRMAGESFLHYPQHLLLVPQWFQMAQYLIYIFMSSFLVAVAVDIIAHVNGGKKVTFGKALRRTLPQYANVCLAALLSFGVFSGCARIYALILHRAFLIRSASGPFFMIKATIVYGAPYVNILMGILVTTIFAFLIPIIVLERKKIFVAIKLNFQCLRKSFWLILFIVLVPTLIYLPVLLLQANLPAIASRTFEEIRLAALVLSIVVMLLIDATIYTAVTIYYLLQKEE